MVKKSIGWGRTIVELNSTHYVTNLIDWWNTKGRIIHNNETANKAIKELAEAVYNRYKKGAQNEQIT